VSPSAPFPNLATTCFWGCNLRARDPSLFENDIFFAFTSYRKSVRNFGETPVKGTLDMLILKVVALGPIHGYAIAQRVQQISREFFQLQQGSLYPALHRLEDRGWLKAEWKATETGRDAKFYALTPKGRKQLEAEVRNWEQLTDAVALILRTAE
jgi:transcriptional regulator